MPFGTSETSPGHEVRRGHDAAHEHDRDRGGDYGHQRRARSDQPCGQRDATAAGLADRDDAAGVEREPGCQVPHVMYLLEHHLQDGRQPFF